MKKIILALFVLTVASFSFSALTNAETTSSLATKTKVKKDVIKDKEYAQIKREFFDADGYGDVYNCKVEKQRFCKVKDLDTGIFVLCDRDVSRTQMESAKVLYKLGRCTKLN